MQLLDCGATSPILQEAFVKEHEIFTKKRCNPIKIWNACQHKIARAVWQPLAIRTLILTFLLNHICTCFGLCNSLGGHICGDSYEG